MSCDHPFVAKGKDPVIVTGHKEEEGLIDDIGWRTNLLISALETLK